MRNEIGHGKYYIQVHGDVKYNRRKNKEETLREILDAETDSAEDSSSKSNLPHYEIVKKRL